MTVQRDIAHALRVVSARLIRTPVTTAARTAARNGRYIVTWAHTAPVPRAKETMVAAESMTKRSMGRRVAISTILTKRSGPIDRAGPWRLVALRSVLNAPRR